MSKLTRRQFVKGSIAAMATITVAGTKSSARVIGANDTIRIACAGLNGRGEAHVGAFNRMRNVEITYLVDPDSRTYNKRLEQIGDKPAPYLIKDIRRALEDRTIDAISIATPNHWHALMTVWGAQAGKHVYVEKPCSHNVHEGRIALEMARRHNVIVQHGTQSRSDPAWQNTIAAVRSGRYGRLLVSRALCYKRRDSIGTRANAPTPRELDFNLWTGPAQTTPFHTNLVHYNWHWFWAFGNGDIGNQGVHQFDIARWAIAGGTLPRSVVTVGGRFGYRDQGQTPNSQVSLMDFGDTKMIFEVRGLTPMGNYRGQGIGNIFHMENGVIAGHRFFPRGEGAGEAIPRQDGVRRGPGGSDHFANFIAALRSGRSADLNADIEEGHYSSALCHLANISYQLGTNAAFAPRTRAFGENRDAIETLERMEAHLTERNVRLADVQLKVGPLLQLQPRTENFQGNAEANRLLTRQYREGFVVPDRVA